MADRYFSADPIAGPTVTLSGSEAHHLLHVMRAQPGLAVVLFDGRGGEYAAEVTRCGRNEVELSVGPRQDLERELPFELTLAASLPKGDRQRWLAEKAVELGVSRLIPLRTARCEGAPGEPAAKLARYVIEASKQCGRNRLMEIAPAVEWSALVLETGKRRIVAHPGGWPLGELSLAAADTLVAVGPEGGFTDEEIARAADTDWQVVDLGARILRVETAALTLLAALSIA
jgi:16S rRNA (uracil1498-N3)-methyltransferase